MPGNKGIGQIFAPYRIKRIIEIDYIEIHTPIDHIRDIAAYCNIIFIERTFLFHIKRPIAAGAVSPLAKPSGFVIALGRSDKIAVISENSHPGSHISPSVGL